MALKFHEKRFAVQQWLRFRLDMPCLALPYPRRALCRKASQEMERKFSIAYYMNPELVFSVSANVAEWCKPGSCEQFSEDLAPSSG